jgi:TDG/mug DNA glycosylase family protein
LYPEGPDVPRATKPEDLPPLRDRIRPGVRVLFVGINPGVRSALTGHHFAGYSNRFWKLLYESGLVPRPVTCTDDERLPEFGYGITNLVPRASPGIGDLRPEEYEAGRAALFAKIRRFQPEVVALVGVTLYRALFGARAGTAGPGPSLGLRDETVDGARVFVLPNPSGRNANFSYAEMLDAFRELEAHLATSARSASRPRRRTSGAGTSAQSAPPPRRRARR